MLLVLGVIVGAWLIFAGYSIFIIRSAVRQQEEKRTNTKNKGKK